MGNSINKILNDSYSKQNVDKEDINAVLEVLNSDYLTQV